MHMGAAAMAVGQQGRIGGRNGVSSHHLNEGQGRVRAPTHANTALRARGWVRRLSVAEGMFN